MYYRSNILIPILLATVTTLVGCVPEPDRDSTTIKSASDVKISVGESRPKTEESVQDSSPAPSETASSSPAVEKVAKSEKTDSPEMKAPAKAEASASSSAAPANSYTGPAKFTGRVSVTGNAPELPPLLAQGAVTKDMVCSEMVVPNETAIVSKDGGLANVFVYMKKAPKSGIPEPPTDKLLIDQQGCVFLPHAKIVRVGQVAILKNSDPVAHNVNVKAFQEPYNNVVPANGSVEHTFRYAERLPASTGCDFHTFMSAWILPLEHPWGAVTDENGNFEIANLPDGDWEFVIWHEKIGYIERGVKVKASQNKLVEMKFEVPASKLSQ